MRGQPPTYYLGPDFDEKLTMFVSRFLADGFSFFALEFSGLDEFIAEALADSSDRNDHFLRRSAKELYLLEAVSFRIHDELNRDSFNRAKNTLIILPDCLSLHNPDCIKTDEKWGDVCQQCTEDCQAYEICRIGERFGIETVFSKRKLADQIGHFAGQSGDLAVVGIACLMMLASGMRQAWDVGVPARGVLLDFTGCEHWNDDPFASEFHLRKLESILEEKYGE